MSNRMLVYAVSAVVIGILLLFAVNIKGIQNPVLTTFITPNDIRGMSVTHNGKPYTLNFEQQNAALSFFNQSIPVDKTDYHDQKELFEFSEITIYQFNKPDIIITPLSTRNRNIVYACPTWNPNGYLVEISAGRLWDLLNSAIDH